MTESPVLDNFTIVLKQPRYPENIGAAVRAGHNMGIKNLIVVDPENFDRKNVLKMATHALTGAVDEIQMFDDLPTALAPFNYVIGSTARLGKHRSDILTPSAMAEKACVLAKNNRVALVFGPEDRGLTNEDIKNCHILVNIPTVEFTSLNLAQAVMVICYAVAMADRKEPSGFSPRLARRHELEAMYDSLQDILIRISFLNAENPEYWMNNLRRFLNRLPLRAKEVSIVRGICRQIHWYGEKRYKDGAEDR